MPARWVGVGECQVTRVLKRFFLGRIKRGDVEVDIVVSFLSTGNAMSLSPTRWRD